MGKLLRRLQYLLRREQAERDLQEEIAAHREMAGSSIGPELRLREEVRDAWGATVFDELWHDLRYGVRMLWRSPGFTLTAVGVLALGMGANLAMFHIFNAALFHRLSIRDANEILTFTPHRFSVAGVEFLRKNADQLRYLVAERTDATVFLESDSEAETATFVSPNYFTDLGATASRGRLIDARDADPGGRPVAVLSQAYWQRRFGGDANAIGRTVRLNGQPVEIVGVSPPDLGTLDSQQPGLWFSIAAHPYLFPGSPALSDVHQRDMELYGVAKKGVSAASASEQLRSLAAEWDRQYPDASTQSRDPRLPGVTGRLVTQVPEDALIPIALVTFLTMLVLVTACANLGNVLLARGLVREREIGIRVAVGAGTGRIVRQLMAENILLAVLGAVAGLALGSFLAKTLVSLVHAPIQWGLQTDWRMLAISAVLAAGAAGLFGLAPALQTVRRQTGKPGRMRKVLVAVQVGASCFLLILTTLLGRSVQRYLDFETRFDYRNMIVLDPQLYSRSLSGSAALDALNQIATRIRQVGGVTGITISVAPPFSNRPARVPGSRIGLDRRETMPDYFDVMNLPVVRGRLFRANEEGAVVVSETAARSLFPGEDPVGKTLSLPRVSAVGIEKGKTTAFFAKGGGKEIVGVVRDSSSSTSLNAAEVYVPISQEGMSRALLVVRTAGDPAASLQTIRSAATLPGIMPTATLMRRNADDRGKMQIVTGSVGSLGASATLLAALGLFGLVSFAVAQRTREIGVRMALGAQPADVIAVLVEQYTAPMAIGAAAGCVLAAGVSRLLATQFLGLRALDPWAYVLSLAIFALIGLAAVLIPVQRALRIDPAIALRWE